MKLEAFGVSTCRRIVRDNGSVAGIVEKLTNENWMIFIDGQNKDGIQFSKPAKALQWARRNLK